MAGKAIQQVLAVMVVGTVALNIYLWNRTAEPDPRMVALAVRATVYAMPSPTPWIVEVTRVVEMTRVIEVTTVVTPTPAPTETVTPTLTPTAESATEAAEVSAARVEAAGLAAPVQPEPVLSEPMASEPIDPEPFASEPVVQQKVEAVPQVGCPAESSNQFVAVPVAGGGLEHPDSQHGDLNLALRGYVPVQAAPGLVHINGPTDGDAPQLSGMFSDRRQPAVVGTFRVRDWNWGCGGHGCAGGELDQVEVSLVRLQTYPGEPIRIPSRGAEVYGGGFKALVLYAEGNRITLSYTREDTVANGYVVHLEELCVDPNLVALYRSSNANGRGSLPALREGETLGIAAGSAIGVAVRDRGTFTDPRSRKDWWRDH